MFRIALQFRFLEDATASQEQTKSANNVAQQSQPSPKSSQPSKQSPKLPQSKRDLLEQESVDYEEPVEIPTESTSRKLSSKLSGFLSRSKDQSQTKQPKPSKIDVIITIITIFVESPRIRSAVKDVGDFVPDGELDDDFFQGDDVQNGGNNDDSSDSDKEHNHNPQVAIDEDLSSVEEDPIVLNELPKRAKIMEPEDKISTAAYKSAREVTLTDSESEDESIESEQPSVPALLPPPASLKQARDIILTESEDEDFTVVEQHRIEEKSIKQTTKKPKNDGLLLAFNTPPRKPAIPKESSTKSSKKRSEKSSDITADSPPTKSKKDKRSKGERKSHRKKSNQMEETENESTSAQTTSEDPFGFNTSLDAWLADEVSKLIRAF